MCFNSIFADDGVFEPRRFPGERQKLLLMSTRNPNKVLDLDNVGIFITLYCELCE